MHRYIVIFSLFILFGCAGPNPNPGERTADIAWTSQDFDKAFQITEPMAEKGIPRAQLRMGIFYGNGWGTQPNMEKAEYWYKKALAQKSSGDWAEGKLVGATGEPGFFNQNSDALIAEYNLAQLYYNNNKNLDDALIHINHVLSESGEESVFFCCEFSEGRYFTQEQFLELKKKIEQKIDE